MQAATQTRRWFGLGRPRVESRTLSRESLPSVMLGEATVAGPVSERAAMQLVDVIGCVRAIAEAAACLPLHGYRRLPEGRERLVGGRLVSLLTKPAPATTQSAFVGAAVQSLACRGNCFIGLYGDASGQVAQLGILSPDRVTVEIRRGQPRYRITHESGAQTEHDESDVLHVRLPVVDESGVLGLSPLGAAREALGLNLALTQEASAVVANSSVPAGVLTVVAGPTEDEVMENLRQGIEARHRGPKQRGKIAVLTTDVKWSPLSFSARDSELIAQQRLSTAQICRLFRTPPWLVGAESGDSLTYSTVEGQMRAFLVHCLNPYLVALEQAISDHPRLSSSQVYVEFERSAALEADVATQSEVFARALDPVTGWMTRAEVRRRLNLPPEEAAPPAAPEPPPEQRSQPEPTELHVHVPDGRQVAMRFERDEDGRIVRAVPDEEAA